MYAFSACNSGGSVHIAGTTYYYSSIHDAFGYLSNGKILEVQGTTPFTEDLAPTDDVSFTLSGGYRCDYSAKPFFTTVHGTLTISHGTITIENLIME